MSETPIYTQSQVERLLAAVSAAHLDNRSTRVAREESEEHMPINSKKIRRKFTLNGEEVWVTANTEQEYAEKLLRVCGAAPSGEPQPQKHLFREYAENWFSVFAKPNISNVTAVAYRRQLDLYILPALGDLYLEDITVQNVQAMFNRFAANTRQATKTKTKCVLNQILEMAADDDLIRRNPLRSRTLKRGGLPSTETKPYSVQQMRYLAAHLNDIKLREDRAWLALSISVPLRPEEVLGLRWQDVDTDNRAIHVRCTVTHPTRNRPEFKEYTKTASSVRTLSLPVSIIDLIGERGSEKDFVIGGAQPKSYTQVRRMRERIRKETGFDEPITPRRFRTTVATDISAATHDLKLVQHMLGHSTPQMTLKHYDKGRSDSYDAASVITDCYRLVDETVDEKHGAKPCDIRLPAIGS